MTCSNLRAYQFTFWRTAINSCNETTASRSLRILFASLNLWRLTLDVRTAEHYLTLTRELRENGKTKMLRLHSDWRNGSRGFLWLHDIYRIYHANIDSIGTALILEWSTSLYCAINDDARSLFAAGVRV